jgi:hypothetical protein
VRATGSIRGGRAGWRRRLLLAAALGSLACGQAAPVGGDSKPGEGDVVLAHVGKDVVRASELGALPPLADPTQRLDVIIRRKLALAEARRRGLENDPKVRGELEEIRQNSLRQEEGVLRNALFNSVRLGLTVSEEELRAQYEKTKDRYLERQWSLRTQGFASEDEARAADARLGAKGRLDPQQSEAPGPLPAEKLKGPVLVILHELKQPGDRKVVALDRWTIVELVEYLPAAQLPFEAVREKVDLNLRAIRAEELLRAQLDQARTEMGVKVDEAALAAYVAAQRQAPPAAAAPDTAP